MKHKITKTINCGLHTGENQAYLVATPEKNSCHRDDPDQDSDFVPQRASENGEDIAMGDEDNRNPSALPKGITDETIA